MMRISRTSGLACLATCAALANLSIAFGQEESVEKTILADQVRSQGYACNNPISAERIEAESRPEEPVYLLNCDNATYHLRLVPDQAAKVTQIE